MGGLEAADSQVYKAQLTVVSLHPQQQAGAHIILVGNF